MQARYMSSVQGRFTSIDPLQASAIPANPKTWNRYAYAMNNPLRFTDPTGLVSEDQDKKKDQEKPQPQPPIKVKVDIPQAQVFTNEKFGGRQVLHRCEFKNHNYADGC
jgi:hypothetical protein